MGGPYYTNYSGLGPVEFLTFVPSGWGPGAMKLLGVASTDPAISESYVTALQYLPEAQGRMVEMCQGEKDCTRPCSAWEETRGSRDHILSPLARGEICDTFWQMQNTDFWPRLQTSHHYNDTIFIVVVLTNTQTITYDNNNNNKSKKKKNNNNNKTKHLNYIYIYLYK